VIYLRLGVKDSGGKVYAEGSLPATRFDLDPWDENAAPTVLMAAGVRYTKEKLHKVGHFRELLTTNPDRNGTPACDSAF
jgi:hypothetical protein